MFNPDTGSEFYHPTSKIPDPRQKIHWILDSRSATKNFKPKKFLLSSQKYDPGCPGSGIFPIPDHRSRGKKTLDPGSATLVKIKESKRQNLIEQKETQSNKTFLEAFSPFFCWAPSHGQPGWPAMALATSLGKTVSGKRHWAAVLGWYGG